MRYFVLLATATQFVGFMYVTNDTFATASRDLPTLIQPAGYTFGIWSLIYLLSIIFALYQWPKKNDNQLLRALRLPVSFAFIGSAVWLYLAATPALLWYTVPTLVCMALLLNYAITRPQVSRPSAQFFSQTILMPYAAWTGVAQFVNIQAVLNQENIITTTGANLTSNVLILILATTFLWYFYRKTNYSLWYGGVITWASIGIVSANIDGQSYLIAAFAVALALASLYFMKKTNYGRSV